MRLHLSTLILKEKKGVCRLCNFVTFIYYISSNRVAKECKKHGIKYFLISARVTQSYDAGCCIYFYFGFNGNGVENPLKCYGEIEDAARDEILAVGGSISHHHGVGKVRAKWYPEQVSELGVELYKLTKSQLDPKNIFANGNLLTLHSNL